MAISHLFGNRLIKLPGAYAEIKASVNPNPVTADYSKILFIDTGQLGNWGGGPGVAGEWAQGRDSISVFRSAGEMQAFVSGGLLYKAAEGYFNPSKFADTQGASAFYYIKAALTSGARMTLTFGSGTNGQFIVSPRHEGSYANGVEFTNPVTSEVILTTGYSMQMETGVKDQTKFRLKILQGTYTGAYTDGIAFNEVAQKDAYPIIVALSPEFSNLQQLIDWARTDDDFNKGFVWVKSASQANDESGVALGAKARVLAASGSQTYSAQYFDEAIEAAKCIDASFIIADRFGIANMGHANNDKLIQYATQDARFKCYVCIAAGSTKTEFSQSRSFAQTQNSDYVIVTHGGAKKASTVFKQHRLWNSFIMQSYQIGRIAGMPPQVPPTFKEMDVQGVVHDLVDRDKEFALDSGLLVTVFDDDLQRYCILKGVNTLQNNTALVNPDGSSPSIQIRRIAEQVNKEIILDAKKEIFSQRNGVTISTVSAQFLQDWIELKLKQKTDAPRQLIAHWENVTVVRQQDAYLVSYFFRPSYEINFIFATGFMID